MLLSHSHKFIFLKTIKTAGTSIEVALQKEFFPAVDPRDKAYYEGSDGIVGARGADVGDAKYWNHMSARQVFDRVGRETFDGYAKVTSVRNPFDKVVSWFFFGFHKRGEFQKDREVFNEFIQSRKRLPIDRPVYVLRGVVCCQHVIRYENLQEDANAAMRSLSGREDAELELGLEKAGGRDRSIAYQDYYDQSSRDIVSRAFWFELDRFGYSFRR